MSAAAVPRSVAARELGSLLAPWRWHLILVAGCVIAAALFELIPPLVVRQLVDEHLARGRADGLLELGLLYLGGTAAALVASFAAAYLTAVAAQGTLHHLRERLLTHLQRLPIGYFDRTPLGDTISRCTADVETVDTLFSSGVAQLVANLVRLVFVAIAMVALSPGLTLVAALVIPPMVAVTRFFQIRVRDAERANRLAVGRLNAHLQETLGGVDVIRPLAREEVFVQRFRFALADVLAAFNRATYYSALYPPVTGGLAALATATLLWAGTGGALSSWGVSLGTLTGFVLLFQRAFQPIVALGDEWQTVQGALSGAERIFQVLALPVDEPASDEDSRVPREREMAARSRDADGLVPALDVRDVVFGYVPERPILRGVSIRAGAGEHVALVGRTGAGKTSLVHLIGGLYAPTSGTLRVDGRDPRRLDPDERRSLVGVVPQVVQLFSGSLRENLTLGDTSVALPALERAAAMTGADAVARSLPNGFDTLLSGAGRGAGAQLSAGQRQLVALTRALVWSPRLLLLDEATAAIDNASDAAFRQALRTGVLASGGAIVTVAHRLSTAREADRVIVLEHGRVIEEGPPEELIARGGAFAALVELEAAGWDWREADG